MSTANYGQTAVHSGLPRKKICARRLFYNARQVTATIPGDIDGVYVRTGDASMPEPIGRYHLFDGDGGGRCGQSMHVQRIALRVKHCASDEECVKLPPASCYRIKIK